MLGASGYAKDSNVSTWTNDQAWKIIDVNNWWIYWSWLIIVGVVFFGLMMILNNLLQGGACKKCPNFACPMNKTPKDYFKMFLAKDENNLIKNACKKEKKDWYRKLRFCSLGADDHWLIDIQPFFLFIFKNW